VLMKVRVLALIVFCAALSICASAQDAKRNAREVEKSVSPSASVKTQTSDARYAYEFTQNDFYIRHILIKHDDAGHGTISFARKGEDEELTERVEISPAALERIKNLWSALNFLDSKENYQSAKQFPHLGAMRLKMSVESRERTAEFNWTENKDAFALVNEYRRLAEQSLIIFDINIARENRPLDAPKLLSRLEELVKRNEVSDARQMLPFLQDLSTDERIPLMARNTANKIIKAIDKRN
jgi:hypothetical protein